MKKTAVHYQGIIKPEEDNPLAVMVFSEQDFSKRIVVGEVYKATYFAVLIITKGSMIVKHNLREFWVKENSLFFIMPSTVYEFSDISQDFKVQGCVFSIDYLSQTGVVLSTPSVVEVMTGAYQPYYAINVEETKLLLNLYEVLKKALAEEQAVAFIGELKKYSFLSLFYHSASIYARYNVSYKVKLNRREELTIGFLRLLSKHYKEERSVQFYADQLFVTPKHLTQMLKEGTGRTTGSFIDRAVIVGAKLLLKDRSLNIAQVAQELNFTDQFTFAKYFKKHTGITPSQFRADH
ncbi:AraC family transcriptional regulator [Pedobacter gandavensis]|uniref:Helix-turn-helix domain-containing protein n=1 Tax=Pedobacter gandavensis TaxID=2679963 RepID=A0ABR6EYA6_9SPHI|nr:AraC family transcriptional regulator [Pedobacter gandavensis]MBB2149941.1 helix-turn-helix domain-containing protein [Pedobacter gandavensis]